MRRGLQSILGTKTVLRYFLSVKAGYCVTAELKFAYLHMSKINTTIQVTHNLCPKLILWTHHTEAKCAMQIEQPRC